MKCPRLHNLKLHVQLHANFPEGVLSMHREWQIQKRKMSLNLNLYKDMLSLNDWHVYQGSDFARRHVYVCIHLHIQIYIYICIYIYIYL